MRDSGLVDVTLDDVGIGDPHAEPSRMIGRIA
jgi:hypothetical protein